MKVTKMNTIILYCKQVLIVIFFKWEDLLLIFCCCSCVSPVLLIAGAKYPISTAYKKLFELPFAVMFGWLQGRNCLVEVAVKE